MQCTEMPHDRVGWHVASRGKCRVGTTEFFSFFSSGYIYIYIFVSISLHILIPVLDNELSLVVHVVGVLDVASDMAWCRRGQHLACATCFDPISSARRGKCYSSSKNTRKRTPKKRFFVCGQTPFSPPPIDPSVFPPKFFFTVTRPRRSHPRYLREAKTARSSGTLTHPISFYGQANTRPHRLRRRRHLVGPRGLDDLMSPELQEEAVSCRLGHRSIHDNTNGTGNLRVLTRSSLIALMTPRLNSVPRLQQVGR